MRVDATLRGSGGVDSDVDVSDGLAQGGATAPPTTQQSNESGEQRTDTTSPPQHTCTECARSFTTKTGLGVHRRRAHPVAANAEINTERVKARWSDEEVTLMAAEEARLTRAGTTFLNEPLTAYMPGRTLESVKGRRRHPAYKALVTRLLAVDDVVLVPIPEDVEGDGNLLVTPNTAQDRGGDILRGVPPSVRVLPDGESAEYFLVDDDDQPINLMLRPDIVVVGEDPETRGRGGEIHLIPPAVEATSPAGFVRRYIQCIPHSRRATLNTLLSIAAQALDGVNVDSRIEGWVSTTFPNTIKPRGPVFGRPAHYTGSRRTQRRARYARVQQAFEKSRRDASRMVLLDTDTTSITLPSSASMLSYWSQVLADTTTPSSSIEQRFPPTCPGLERIWDPITEAEVLSAKVRQGSASGPDGVRAKSWCRVSVQSRTLLFNIFLLIGHLPSKLKASRTMFLAKKKTGSNSPSDFRPISISSVITRQFHRILANRFTKLYVHRVQQSAYQHFDGVGKSVALLRTFLDNSWRERKELHIACLDAAKAFNSVTFDAIRRTLVAVGCPSGFTAYISDLYSNVRTTLQFEGVECETTVGKGVLQGDPLSGPIFMAVFESAIRNLDEHVGFRTGGSVINSVAYADDIVLVATTRRGLQRNLDKFDEGLRPVGLTLNQSKSFSLSMIPAGKQKKVKIDTSQSFRVAGGQIRPMGVDDVWTYLGLDFEGKNTESFDGKLPAGLDKITKAPLKPQQRLTMLRENVVPGILHRLVLGTTTATKLKAADVTVRQYVRKWLHLPHDVPLGFLYTPQKHGGLGLPCLQHIVPLLRMNRYTRIRDTMDGALSSISESRHVAETIHRAKQALHFLGDAPTKNSLNEYWRTRLVASVDGKELERVGHHASETRWAGALSSKTSGEDYVHHTAIRINAIPSRDRTTRGRKGQPSVVTSCRGGCPDSETTYHAIQTCYRSKGMRMQRHNRVVDLLHTELERRGFSVAKEKRLETASAGAKQPDLVAVMGDTATIIDAQVVSGQNVEASHFHKIDKYHRLRGFDDDIRRRYRVEHVVHIPCTITYRGLWSKKSIVDLVSLGLSDRVLHMIVTSVLRGSWMCWRLFNRATHVNRR